MGGKIIPGLLGVGLKIGQVTEIHGGMITDIPSGVGQEQEQHQVKIVGREDPEGTAGEEIQGYIPTAGIPVFFREQDGGDKVTAQYKKERDEGPHVDGKRDL
jgi:hypothetical protein